MSNKIPLLMYSGGLDSTYMLLHYLKYTDVDIVSTSGIANPLKDEKELEARNKILDILKQRNLPFNVRHKHHVSLNKANNNHGAFFQQHHHWIYTLACCVKPDRHSSVKLGYLMSDDIAHMRHEIIESWKHLSTVMFDDPIPLELPLIKHNKKLVIQSLENIDPEIAKYVWYCESPVKTRSGKNIVKCNKCSPCITQKFNRELISNGV